MIAGGKGGGDDESSNILQLWARECQSVWRRRKAHSEARGDVEPHQYTDDDATSGKCDFEESGVGGDIVFVDGILKCADDHHARHQQDDAANH